MAPSKKSPAPKKAAAKKAAPKKAAAKKAVPKKAVPKKAVPKKAVPKKAVPKKAVPKKAVPKKAVPKKAVPKKAVPKKAVPKKAVLMKTTARKAAPKKALAKKAAPKRGKAQPPSAELFAQLTEGERAESLRLLLEDNRLANMAKVGRYRVIAVEPLSLKSDNELASSRLARVVIYDYSSDRCVQANIDLDHYVVRHLSVDRSQPMLAPEEEIAAMEIAVIDDRVRSQLSLGQGPQAAMHYWSDRPSDLSYSRRSAAVLLGEHGARPSLVAVVDLLDARVTEVVLAELW